MSIRIGVLFHSLYLFYFTFVKILTYLLEQESELKQGEQERQKQTSAQQGLDPRCRT